MAEPRIAVTGATGTVGGLVAAALAARGVAQRLLVRDLARAPRLPGATASVFSYADAPSTRAALDGIETVLMVSAHEGPDRLADHRTFVAAAADAGVRHVVYTSFMGAAPDATFTLARDHFHTERALRDSGMAWTFLRDCFYADFLPAMVGADGVLRGPAGDGRCAFVARADVAPCAAAVCADPAAHAGATYDLTGPESLSLAEVAALLPPVQGRPVVYHPETVEEAYASRAVYRAPDWEVDAWVSTYTAIASGVMAPVSDAVGRLLGRPATSLAALLASSA